MNAAARPDLTLEAFERGAVDASTFDHEAHVYIGWLYLLQYPLLEAIRRYCTTLQQLTRQLGVPDKYHETITWFFLIQIDERRRSGNGSDWFEFRRQNTDLFEAGSLLARYYSPERLSAAAAKHRFLLPDRLAEPVALRTGP